MRHHWLPFFLSYLICSYWSVSTFIQITLAHFSLSSYEWALCLLTSFSISGLAILLESFWVHSCFPLLLLGKFPLLAVPSLLGNYLPSMWSPPFRLYVPALIPSLLPSAALVYLHSLPPHDLMILD